MNWEEKIVPPQKVLRKIRPGMRIFLGTGVSEPRTLVKHLIGSTLGNLADLQLIQLTSFSGDISLQSLETQKYRLTTFSPGEVVDQAITAGLADLIPNRFVRLPRLFESGRIGVDAAFVQITPPDLSGYCSLGVSIDVARIAMEKASLVVGEINMKIPRTSGDTFVHFSQFDYLVQSRDDPVYFDPWKVLPPFEQVAAHIATLIPDTSCLAFSIGPLFDALSGPLARKKDLGVHSPVFTDALMELIQSGAVTNRYKRFFRGKSIASYALGSPDLMKWLDHNPVAEFQAVELVFDPANIGSNPGVVSVIPARKVDLSGCVVLNKGQGTISSGPMELLDFFMGAEISQGGRTIIGLPGRNRDNEPNVILSAGNQLPQLGFRQSIDMVVTEFGVATIKGLSIRERAQALIEIAHPDDRKDLVELAKDKKILYPDQIFLSESVHLFPNHIDETRTFKQTADVRFRATRPSDEEQMRRLFYRFSDEAIYYRYFVSVKTMPHSRMQEYVNVDWARTMSVVGLVGEPGHGRIIAEGRYLMETFGPAAEVAFVVDEEYNNLGIATQLLNMLIKLGKERGIQTFTADVLFSNISMMRVFRKAVPRLKAVLEEGVYHVELPLSSISR